MDGLSFFNIGFSELLFVLVLAGLVMGPTRIRQVARWLGETTAKLQGISRQFRSQLNNELDAAESEDLKGAIDDIRALQMQVTELRRELASTPNKLAKEAKVETPLNGTSVPNSANGTPPTNTAAKPENSIAPALPSIVEIEDDLE